MTEKRILPTLAKTKTVKDLKPIELKVLAREIREEIIEVVSENGGHLASNLGVVELTLALHRVFDFPKDQLVFDVSHQSYTHKLITGRYDSFHSLRKAGGLTGYTNPKESEYDLFATGHASTSISSAMGLKTAKDIKGEEGEVIALIGDGALTGGLAFEALNNLGHSDKKVIVIINDNERSISDNVGALNSVLNNLRTSKKYRDVKRNLSSQLPKIPFVGKPVKNALVFAKSLAKQAFVSGMFFEEMGLTYIGIINGHDIGELCSALNMAKYMDGPIVVHVATTKGRGYRKAMLEPGKYHGVSAFQREEGLLTYGDYSTYSDVFGTKILDLAEKDERVCAITAAMSLGTKLSKFENKYPSRFFDVGIAEGHAMTFSAGLAKNGLKPYFAVYSTFLQRAYDMLIHDVCLQDLPVTLCLDRCGLVGDDGATHHGVFDLNVLLSLPNLELISPYSKVDMDYALDYSLTCEHPLAIRYPRGLCPVTDEKAGFDIVSKGEGSDVVIFAFGTLYGEAKKALDLLKDRAYGVKLCKLLRLKPLDEAGIKREAEGAKLVVTIEDSMITGGMGSLIRTILAGSFEKNEGLKILNLGYPDRFVEHGNIAELNRELELDGRGIAASIERAYTETV